MHKVYKVKCYRLITNNYDTVSLTGHHNSPWFTDLGLAGIPLQSESQTVHSKGITIPTLVVWITEGSLYFKKFLPTITLHKSNQVYWYMRHGTSSSMGSSGKIKLKQEASEEQEWKKRGMKLAPWSGQSMICKNSPYVSFPNNPASHNVQVSSS